MANDLRCAECGAAYGHHYRAGAELERMKRDGVCFVCAIWSLTAERKNETVIDGTIYSPGSRTSGSFRGMAGRRFDIEYFDGHCITTFDLWCGGTAPEKYRDRIPDTARFLGDAERVQVGEITCFNPSRGNAEPYPLPNSSERVNRNREPLPAETA